jgi:hypothetical protein
VSDGIKILKSEDKIPGYHWEPKLKICYTIIKISKLTTKSRASSIIKQKFTD